MIGIFDVDDFREPMFVWLHELERIKEQVPKFKVNLFSIPALLEMNSIAVFGNDESYMKWIRLIPHGWRHNTSRECEIWGTAESIRYLNAITRVFPLANGFKAPGWLPSQRLVDELLRLDFWLADHVEPNFKRPERLKTYTLADEKGFMKRHYHFGHMHTKNTNDIREHLDSLIADAKKCGEFMFIDEYIEKKY